VCWPHSIFQGHGIWHLATAAAIMLLARHYTEAPPTKSHRVLSDAFSD
jgi:hypothetical protein